jgi:cold-inducible RNA-binding protein
VGINSFLCLSKLGAMLFLCLNCFIRLRNLKLFNLFYGEFFMSTKLYVGNLPYSAKEDGLRAHFESAGAVSSVKIIIDRETGRSKGFAFVEMENEDAARNAVSSLDGHEYEGRSLRVSEAKPQPERENRGPRTGGGGFNRGGGDRGGDRGGRGFGGGNRRD